MRAYGWVVGAGALLTGLAVLAAGLQLSGYDAPAALGALWSGAFGSWYALTSATLVRAVPLIVIGLGLAAAAYGLEGAASGFVVLCGVAAGALAAVALRRSLRSA